MGLRVRVPAHDVPAVHTTPQTAHAGALLAPTPPPLLHHDLVTAEGARPERWLVVLHGIYGSGRNWNTVAKRVVRARPEWAALLVDLRQHGASRGFAPPHTLAAAAEDVARLTEGTGLSVRGILGHSFGGKVALLHAREPGSRLATLWLVDSTPEARPPSGSAWEMLEALRGAPGPFADRDEGVAALVAFGVARPVAQWMALNLERGDAAGAGWHWRLDPDDMEALLTDFFRTDLWPVVESPPPGLDAHVVKAEESSVLDEPVCARIEAAGARTGRVHLHRVAGGHWVNADNPDTLVGLLETELP